MIHTRDMRMPGQKAGLGLAVDWGCSLARGLGALWLFNEGAGLAANDLGGSGVIAAPSDDRMWSAGGLKFSGSNCASFADDPRAFKGDEVSIFASIIPTGFGATHDDSAVFTKGVGPYTIYFTVGGGKANVYSEGNASWLDGSASIPANVRSVVGFSKDAAGRKVWLNGKVDASDSVTNSLSWGSTGGRIGHRQDNFHPSDQFVGVIEWVAFWNRGLTAAEAALLAMDPYALVLQSLVRRSYNLPGGALRFRRTVFDRVGARGFMRD